MLLGLLIAAPPGFTSIPYSATDPRLKRIQLVPDPRSNNMGLTVNVLLDGYRMGGAPEQPQVKFAPCARSKGIAFNVMGDISAGYLAITHLGVVAWPGFRRAYSDLIVQSVARDGSVLLMSDDQAPSQEALKANLAWIDRKGRRTQQVGPADEAWLLPDGSVLGRAFRNPSGGYSNAHSQASGTQPESFLWSNGKRKSLGSWWPMDVSPKGVAIGFRDGREGFQFTNDDRHGALVRWERGRLKPVNLGGREGCLPIVARDDGSFLLGIVGKDGRRIAVLRGDRLKVHSHRIDDQANDSGQTEVDRRGQIVLEGRNDLKGQIRRTR